LHDLSLGVVIVETDACRRLRRTAGCSRTEQDAMAALAGSGGVEKAEAKAVEEEEEEGAEETEELEGAEWARQTVGQSTDTVNNEKGWEAKEAGEKVERETARHPTGGGTGETMVNGTQRTPLFWRLIRGSVFGLVPRGWGLHSYRLLETMRGGAIPVLVGDGAALPFESVVDWSASAVVVAERNIEGIPARLARLRQLPALPGMQAAMGDLFATCLSSNARIVAMALAIVRCRAVGVNGGGGDEEAVGVNGGNGDEEGGGEGDGGEDGGKDGGGGGRGDKEHAVSPQWLRRDLSPVIDRRCLVDSIRRLRSFGEL
jgi:hypothetical protein